MFTLPTLHLLAELLDQVQLPATHPRLVAAARVVADARTEMADALAQAVAIDVDDDTEPVEAGA